MIHINRTDPPTVLSSSTARRRYGHQDVVRNLFNMQHGKCCYCEEYLPNLGPGKQVEHFRPQSKYKKLTNDWNNLLLSCETCNSRKSNKFPLDTNGDALLLDPSDCTKDPEQHIEFVVDLVEGASDLRGLPVPRNSSDQGRATINAVELYMPHHLKRRRLLISLLGSYYYRLLDEIDKAQRGCGSPEKLDQVRKCLYICMQSEAEYAGVARSFYRRKKLHALGVRLL